tara:strand:+ start:122 stop:376 length:255 start_codon:yes stop_codon:yes gene_type:complete
MSKLDKQRQGKANTIIMDIEEFLSEIDSVSGMDETDVLEFFADIICQLDTDIAIEVMEHFPEGKDIAQMMKDRIVLLNQNKDET